MLTNLRSWVLPTHNNGYRAYLLTNKAFSLYLAFMVMLNLFVGNISNYSVEAQFSEQYITELHNRERGKMGLSQLRYNSKLSESARLKAEAMIQSDCWSHYCPDGKSPWDFFGQVGYGYVYAGENLAEGFKDAETMMNAWMNSKTHRENVHKTQFTEIGIGMATGRFQDMNNNTVVVVHFGTPSANSVIASDFSTDMMDILAKTGNENVGSDSSEKYNSNSNLIKVESPEDGAYLNEPRPEIRGEESKPIDIELNGDRLGRIIPEGGLFSYRPENEISDGEKKLVLKIAEDGSKYTTRNFNIDTVPPVISEESTVFEYMTRLGDAEDYFFEYNSNEPLAGLAIFLKDSNKDVFAKPSNVNQTKWSFSVNGNVLGTDIVIRASDLAGNSSEEVFRKLYLLDLVEKEGLDSFGSKNESRFSLLGNLQRIFKFGSFEGLLMIFILVLIILLVIEYFALQKLDPNRLKQFMARYLHLSILASMFIVIVIGNLGGNI